MTFQGSESGVPVPKLHKSTKSQGAWSLGERWIKHVLRHERLLPEHVEYLPLYHGVPKLRPSLRGQLAEVQSLPPLLWNNPKSRYP